MPIYEFTCEQCGAGFEELIRGSERPRCPACESERVAKRFSAFAVGREGAGAAASAFEAGAPGCGTCGDPRGPGACALD